MPPENHAAVPRRGPLLQRVRRLIAGEENHPPPQPPPLEAAGLQTVAPAPNLNGSGSQKRSASPSNGKLQEQSFPEVDRHFSSFRAYFTEVAGQIAQDLGQRLDKLQARVEALQHLSTPQSQETPKLQEQLAALEKQIIRAGREQLKTNSLVAAQAEHLTAALALLREAEAQREATHSSLRHTQGTRLELAQSIIPALDGLDEALRSGQRFLGQTAEAAPPTIFERLLLRATARTSATEALLRERLDAWLVGLTFVRQRLLDLLQAEGIEPMLAEGQPFNPHQHVALETVWADQDWPPGIVVAEIRRGYLLGERVLRYAEVTVAKAAP